MTIITRSRGDTYPIEILVTADDVALDISSCIFTLTVDPNKNPVDGTDNVIVLTGSLPGDTGRVDFPLTDEQADNLGKYYYDIQMIDGSGLIRTIAKDRFVWVQDITKGP